VGTHVYVFEIWGHVEVQKFAVIHNCSCFYIGFKSLVLISLHFSLIKTKPTTNKRIKDKRKTLMCSHNIKSRKLDSDGLDEYKKK